MKVVVCLKQVPDPDLLKFDLLTNELHSVYWILNPADLFALEEGLKIKEKYQGEVTVLSVAPPRAEKVLKRALIYGANRAIRVWEDWMADVDAWIVSSVIAKVLEGLSFDLILCGARSKDTSCEFMGAGLAEKLNVSLITRAVGIEFKGKEEVIAHKKLERGERETYTAKLPAVITIEEGPEATYIPPLSRTFREGFGKQVEVISPNSNLIDLKPLTQPIIPLIQPKPRTKRGPKVAGLSVAEELKLARGEAKGEKEIFFGSPEEGAKKIREKLVEWMS